MALQANLQISSNADQVSRFLLHTFGRKVIRRAAADSMNTIAFSAMREVREQMPNRFTIRNQRVIRGVVVAQKANTRQWPRTRVVLGDKDPFMELQERGGLKTPKAGRTIAVPNLSAVKRTATGKIRKAQLPASIMRRKTAAVLPRSGRKPAMITAKGRGNQRTAYYRLYPRTHITPRFGFDLTVRTHFRRRLPVRFRREYESKLARALRGEKNRLQRRFAARRPTKRG